MGDFFKNKYSYRKAYMFFEKNLISPIFSDYSNF